MADATFELILETSIFEFLRYSSGWTSLKAEAGSRARDRHGKSHRPESADGPRPAAGRECARRALHPQLDRLGPKTVTAQCGGVVIAALRAGTGAPAGGAACPGTQSAGAGGTDGITDPCRASAGRCEPARPVRDGHRCGEDRQRLPGPHRRSARGERRQARLRGASATRRTPCATRSSQAGSIFG